MALAPTKEQLVFLQAAAEADKPLSVLRSKGEPELKGWGRDRIYKLIVSPMEDRKWIERKTYPNGKFGFTLTVLGKEVLRMAAAAQEEREARPPLQITPPRTYVIGAGDYVAPKWETR